MFCVLFGMFCTLLGNVLVLVISIRTSYSYMQWNFTLKNGKKSEWTGGCPQGPRRVPGGNTSVENEPGDETPVHRSNYCPGQNEGETYCDNAMRMEECRRVMEYERKPGPLGPREQRPEEETTTQEVQAEGLNSRTARIETALNQ